MMEADHDDAPRPFASSACFMHEAESGELDAAVMREKERRAEIMAWRKGERARLIA
jgi:5-formyltetrahydrofolate cyclo-ligase